MDGGQLAEYLKGTGLESYFSDDSNRPWTRSAMPVDYDAYTGTPIYKVQYKTIPDAPDDTVGKAALFGVIVTMMYKLAVAEQLCRQFKLGETHGCPKWKSHDGRPPWHLEFP